MPRTDTSPAADGSRPANRAERRAAARGRRTGTDPAGVPAPRTSGPRVRTAPVHTRADYAARRSG